MGPSAPGNHPNSVGTAAQVEQGPQGATATSGDWYNSQRGGHVSNQDAAGPISKSPMPEYWCSIAYFELDTQVGYTFFLLGRLGPNLIAKKLTKNHINFY